MRLVDDMVHTMYDAPGAGLAAPQVGVQKRMFVYDVGDGPEVMVNPTIVESSGEWYYDEGCLSIPELRLGIVRPKAVHITGFDLDGNEISIEADDFLARVFQHEVDHLDGVLMVERLDEDLREAGPPGACATARSVSTPRRWRPSWPGGPRGGPRA